ncbi:MAG: hypothetical protein IPH54_22350 [Rhodoferax sp.]|nr:hypothetical protein [Rhodoferax sp.]
MPADGPGMAFVLVQHLAPDHKSILGGTLLAAVPACRCMRWKTACGLPNRVYIIPPHYITVLQQGVLHPLEPVAPRGPLHCRLTFSGIAGGRSARAGHGHRASGTGSDGTPRARHQRCGHAW